MKKELYGFIKENRLDSLGDTDKNTNHSEVLTTLTVSSLFGLLQYWLVENPDWTVDYLAHIYENFITAGLTSIIKSI